MAKYTIKQGSNSPTGFHFNPITSDEIWFSAMFTPSCIYDPMTLPENDRKDINKLIGFADFLSNNQSCRFGWRYSTEMKQFELLTYIHDGGNFVANSEKVIGYVDPGTYFTGSIKAIKGDKNYYQFTFNGQVVHTIEVNKIVGGLKRQQYPYWGGTTKCPHTMVIYA